MTALFRTPGRRLAVFAALSLLIHAALLGLPHLTLPRHDESLPLLTAKLVPLPKAAQKTGPRKPRPRPASPVPPVLPVAPAVVAASSVPAAPAAASAVPAEAAAASAVPETAMAASAVPATSDYALTSDHAPALPKHARLLYVAQMGSMGLYVGEIRHELEITDGHYTLHAELETTGLARLVKRYQNIQDSRGSSSRNGLRPELFTEAKTDEHGTQRSEAAFDWGAHQLGFASGAKTSLPDGTQDILSFLYQLSQLPYERKDLPLAVSNGRKLEYYKLETGPEEVIDTPMGKLRTLHLIKAHAPGAEGTEIWLGLEYRLLPVKVRQIEGDGKIAGEIVIKEIRVSDE
ncbi:MAG TPA: DUF3108 domain-containing protein [Gallionellaceae bacterium]